MLGGYGGDSGSQTAGGGRLSDMVIAVNGVGTCGRGGGVTGRRGVRVNRGNRLFPNSLIRL